MAKPKRLAVSPNDQRELERLVRAVKVRRSLAERARIILLSANAESAAAIASKLEVTPLTVYKWRRRFVESGLAGLADRPRSGQPRKLSLVATRRILDLTTQRIPHEATHWSVRLMAKYAGVTTWQVRQVWGAADLRPHRLKSFKISNDPQFADKVVDVVG